MPFERNSRHEFVSLAKELSGSGEIRQVAKYEFDFKNVEKAFESYYGDNCKLKYYLRVTISRRMSDITKDKLIHVYSYKIAEDLNNSIKMEVGIEDCLHIEFEYNKSVYHLQDVVVGKIYFMLVRLKVRVMELSILRRESTGPASNQYNENETVCQYEIMDGAPGKGECIPIRLFLGGYKLSPTFRDVNKKFSVRYFLNLVLIDEENRRYFKQQEIVLYRKQEE